MVQSLEQSSSSADLRGGGSKIPGQPAGTAYYTTRHHHVHHHLHHALPNTGVVLPSKIPKRIVPSAQVERCSNADTSNWKDKCPPISPVQYPDVVPAEYSSEIRVGHLRMSRQGKSPAPPPFTGSPAVPGAVAQQAQQYLEQNIMVWMKPKPQGQVLPCTLPTLSSTRDAGSSTSATTSQHPTANQKALQEHMSQGHSGTRNQLSMTSPYAPIGGGPYMVPSISGASCVGLPSSSSIPHSLSFSGYSHHSLMQGTSFSSPCPSTYGSAQPSAAASFFARAAQRLNLSSKRRRRPTHSGDSEPPTFLTNFSEILRTSPPPTPPCLLRSVGRKENFGIGKVKVMLRITPNIQASDGGSSFLNMDPRKKQVTVYDPTTGGTATNGEKRTGVSAPKMFAFDAIFSPDDTQAEVCSSSLPEVIQAVVGGTDGCLFVYGHSKLGKSHTMVGSSDSVQDLGVVPCAISWLFRLIYEQKQKTGARFSVRVSALEVSGRNEVLKDLLSDYATGTEGSGTSPGLYLRDDPVFGTQLINQSELRAPTAEKAAYLLDAAIAARNADGEDEGRNSHFLFTLHLYQYRVERAGKGGVAGGRSRLHLFDLGSCEKMPPKPRDGSSGGGCLSLSALGNVILAIFNGQKHVPYKESKLTQLLREAMNSVTCRVAMIAHVSSHSSHYSEILGTIQLASRVHRMRRRKLKYPIAGPMDSSCDDKGACVRPYVRMHAVNEDGVKSGSSDPDYTSSSEQSCDTVIYVGTGGVAISDRDLTDNEGPPTSLPVIPKTSKSFQTGKLSTTSRLQDPASSSSDIKTIIASSATAVKTALNAEDHHKLITKQTLDKCDFSAVTSLQSKLSRDCKSQQSSETRHGSTQTPGTDPFSAHTRTPQMFPNQRKSKHRTSQHKQDTVGGGSSSLETQAAGASKGVVSASSANVAKDAKHKSDEMWIDGPRFLKPKFDSRTLHQLQKEQWVDGPPVMYGFMDDHKQSMIRRWVEEHSHHMHEVSKKKKCEVWIDFPPGSKESMDPSSSKDEITPNPQVESTAEESSNLLASKEEKVCNKDISLKGTNQECVKEPNFDRRNSKLDPTNKDEDDVELSARTYQTYEINDDGDCLIDDEADSASNSADVDETDNEENAEAIGYDSELHALHIGQRIIHPQDFQEAMYKAQQVILEYSHGDRENGVETIEVMEPEEPVPMMDSCLQVNEEDIIAECWMHANYRISENPLPEVDQGSCDGNEHPLRILSEEGLNLPSSFTDSRSVSVDLDSISVPDTCREGMRGKGDLTWRLLYGNMFQKIKEQQQRQRRTMEDISSAVRNTVLNEKLERIARLRELIQPLIKRGEQIKSGASSPTCPTRGPTLPTLDSRLTLSEMLYNSQDSSMEDLSGEEVKSTQSEPAELDIDKYDYKVNIKPMNGLKLEAFYNKIHKVPPFLEQYSASKPTQVVSPISTNAQEKSLQIGSLEAQKLSPRSSLSRNHKKKSGESPLTEPYERGRAYSLGKSSCNTLRQHDGSCNLELIKHPSLVQLRTESYGGSSSSVSPNPLDRSSGSASCVGDSESFPSNMRSSAKKSRTCELNEISKRTTDQRTAVNNMTYKNIDTSQLIVGQSPTNSSKSRLARSKAIPTEPSVSFHREPPVTKTSTTSLRSKDSSLTSVSKTVQKPSHSSNSALRNTSGKYHPNNNSNTSGGHKLSRPSGACGSGKLPTRASPTSSSTSGVTTTCCTSLKQKEKVLTMKSKPPNACPHVKQKHSNANESKRSQRTKSICRSTSSPSTCVDSGDTQLTDVTDSDHYHVTRHASVSGALASPYHKLPLVQVTHPHRTSSGHGSDSSVNSIEPREAKELLIKGAKTQQFSGTSSGYESMLRDSEGTPLSSSQESGNEGSSIDNSERGRKGRRKSPGSSKRSLSAPARSPPSPTGAPPTTTVSTQPVASNRTCQLRRGDRSLRRSEEEVCCPSLLCCRLLDFY